MANLKTLQPGLPARFEGFFDGCCEPVNPGGTAGFGAVILDRGCRVWEHSGIVEASPTTSNNVAEYLAVNAILDWLLEHGHAGESAHLFGDSRLVICQLWGWPVIGQKRWKIHGIDGPKKKPGRYAEYAVAARDKLRRLPRCLGGWIPREKNTLADELSKAKLHEAGVQFKIQPEESRVVSA